MSRRTLLAVPVYIAMLGAFVGAVVLGKWTTRSYFKPYEKDIIRKELGWRAPSGGHDQLVQMIARQPLPFVQLLAHDSQRVRRWAEQVLVHWRGADHLSDEVIGLIGAELTEKNSHEHYSRVALIRVLASTRGRGVKPLAMLYRSNNPIDQNLHREICDQLSRPDRSELIDALLNVAQDNAVLLENRVRATEALGNMAKPDSLPGQGETTKLAAAKLAGLLPGLPEFVASAARASLQKLQTEPEDWEDTEPSSPGRWHVVSPAKDQGANALAALKDNRDWLRTGRAAEKLARAGMKEAISELQRVADTHWFGPTKKTAAQAVRFLQGQETDRFPTGSLWVTAHEDEDFNAWRKDHAPPNPPTKGFVESLTEPLADSTEGFRHAVFWRLQPRIRTVEFQRPGRLPLTANIDDFGMNLMRPRHAFRFAGGKLLGYDEGEFGAGTVFHRQGETSRFFATPNVQFFFRTPLGAMAYCEAAMVGDLSLYLASEQPDGQVSVDFFMRLPNHSGRPAVMPNGEIMIPCVLGDIIISQSGEIRTVPHSDK